MRKKNRFNLKRWLGKEGAVVYLLLGGLLLILLFFFIQNAFNRIYYNFDFDPEEPLEELTEHTYDFSLLKEESGHYTYPGAAYGIDVSSHQGEIDWQKVKDSGVEFVFLRIGYRGYEQGLLNADTAFEEYYNGAREVGLPVGVYFFSQAIDEREAMEEAYYVLEHIRGKQIDLPIVYDLEDVDYAESRIEAIDAEQRTNNALAFCQKIEENGRTPMIYTNLSWSETYYDLYRIMNYPLWFAQYNNLPGLDYEFVVWQYSDHAEIDGIEELVDTNLYFNFHKQQED